MTDKIFNPKKEWSANVHFHNMEEYKKTYADSIADRDAFWAEKAPRQTFFFIIFQVVTALTAIIAVFLLTS